MKYIQNLTKMKNNVQIEYDSVTGEEQFGKAARVKIDFRPESIDSMNNTLTHTGITPVSDEVFESLSKERNFQYAINDKIGWLKVHDDLPDFAQTPNDVVVAQREQIAQLTARINELEAAGGVAQQVQDLTVQLNDTQAKLDAATGELETTKAANTALTDKVTGLETALKKKTDKAAAAT
jgi:BMFP domain-containing protein YqiC